MPEIHPAASLQRLDTAGSAGKAAQAGPPASLRHLANPHPIGSAAAGIFIHIDKVEVDTISSSTER